MTTALLHTADVLLWIIMAVSVGYVVFFAIVSLFRRRDKQPAVAIVQSRFLVLFPAYNEDLVIRNSITSFLQQDYPHSHFQLTVISDHMLPETNQWLGEQPVRLLLPDFQNSSKAQALQYAIALTHDDFDYVVILDADNMVSADFLTRLNILCAQGHKAIQCHRTAKNSNNDIAELDGVSEEINNTLFRLAHNRIGLSSALIGSGMCFDFKWFKHHVDSLSTAGEDRELEGLLLRQGIYIHYAADIIVRDEKVSSSANFQRQRLRWMTAQIQCLLSMMPYLPHAILTGNINYIDKTLQQALIPRSILLVLTTVMALATLFFMPSWSLKWWCLLLLLALSLIIAIPSRLRTFKLLRDMLRLPQLVWHMLCNVIHIDTKNTDFIHTSHDK
ncbi:MAG: glycosyltransferase family 2 protein [Prevotella sp.]|nr:glycosyltransferase family 2 protein [Prevotella sp.]